MRIEHFPEEFREVIRKVARKNNLTIPEILIIYRAVWKTVYSELNSDSPPVKIMLHGMGELRPLKTWKNILLKKAIYKYKYKVNELIRFKGF